VNKPLALDREDLSPHVKFWWNMERLNYGGLFEKDELSGDGLKKIPRRVSLSVRVPMWNLGEGGPFTEIFERYWKEGSGNGVFLIRVLC